MAGSLHGSARATPRVRAELQASKETTSTLAQHYGLSRTTVTKWRGRTTTADAPMGPTAPHSTVLSPEEEAMVVEFRRCTLLPLDDVLGCLRDTIPKLTRSSLHRCLERHGISRLPEDPDKPAKRGKFADTAIGYVHIDISELRLAEGKLNMFLAIDRVSKFTYVEFRDDAGKMNGADFLRGVVAAFPYAIHTVLTDNGMAFADLPKNRNGPTRRYMGAHIFDRVCAENGIVHKLTKPYHPWTNGQAERMNRTVKDATIKAFHYPGLESLKAHVIAFVSAYNFARHLKALRWKTPFEAVCHAWNTTPGIFKLDPRHLTPGPNTYYEGTARHPIPAGLRPRPDVDPRLMRSTCWENPVLIDFGPVLTTRRNPNLWVLIRATVTHLNVNDSGQAIQSVEVTDANGRRLTIQARAVVLCAGGVENPRILLYSNRQQPAGLGNRHDVVGRYLMDHPRDLGLIAHFDASDTDAFRDLFGPYKLDSIRGRHEFSYGFRLSEEQQRTEHLLNTAAWPYEVQASDDAIEAARRLVKGPRNNAVGDARLVVSQANLVARALHTRLVKGQRVHRKAERIGFLVASEQVPDPESRVQLAQRNDWLGLPITRVDWRVAEVEARSQATLAKAIASEFERLTLPRVRLAEWVGQDRFADAKFMDGCHPTGTTRMAVDPRNGVVDSDCQVHGVDKLYIAGSSVFPTASHANPTLMIVALAVRLSDHLKRTLATRAGPGVTRQASLVLAD